MCDRPQSTQTWHTPRIVAAAQQALTPDAALLRFAAQVKRQSLGGIKHMTEKQQSKRIPKSFEERRAELVGALDVLRSSLNNFDQSRQTHWLKKVAQELRAQIVYEPKSRSLHHPLLLDLAKEKQYPLFV